jgi:NAD(P)-dependent dehydrogenase (short-subunit alcohol dehydrogenase family)
VAMLDGRVAIVTGGGRGIGRSHCLELASQGATVVVNDLGAAVDGTGIDATPAQEVVEAIRRAGGTAIADCTSVTDWEGVAGLVHRTVERYGSLDVVVNNAGIIRDHMITSLSEDDWDQVVSVHLKGTFTVTKHACDHWRAVAKAGGRVAGRIVNTTSGTGLFGNVGQAPYGAAKAAIANLTVITAMEMQRYAVTANAISPMALTRMGATMTGMEGYDPDPGWDPMDPGNSSPLVAWLASPASGWLTGQVLRVVAGTVWRMRPWEIDERPYRASGGGRLDAGELDLGLRRLYGILPAGIPSAG